MWGWKGLVLGSYFHSIDEETGAQRARLCPRPCTCQTAAQVSAALPADPEPSGLFPPEAPPYTSFAGCSRPASPQRVQKDAILSPRNVGVGSCSPSGPSMGSCLPGSWLCRCLEKAGGEQGLLTVGCPWSWPMTVCSQLCPLKLSARVFQTPPSCFGCEQL